MSAESSNAAAPSASSAAISAISAAKQRQLGLSTNVLAIGSSWAAIPLSSSLCLLQLPDMALFNASAGSAPTGSSNSNMLTQVSVSQVSVPATCVGFDREGKRMLTGGDDKIVRLWDALPPSAAPIRQWTHGKKIGCVAFSPDGNTVLFADLFGEVYTVSLLAGGGAEPTIALGHLSPISHMAFHPSAPSLLTADREGHVRSSAWPHAFVIDCYYLEHTSPLVLMLPLAAAPLILTCATDGKAVCAWTAHTGELLRKHEADELLSMPPPPQGGADASSSGAAEPAAVACGCEVEAQGLVALGTRGRGFIHFATASPGGLQPHPELAVALPLGAPAVVAMSYSAASATLCALLAGGEGVALLPAKGPSEGGRGFGPPALMRFNAPEPERLGLKAPLAADGQEAKGAKRAKTDGDEE